MALWLVRAGRHGEHEERFFSDDRIYLTWGDTFKKVDPTKVKTFDDVRELTDKLFPNAPRGKRAHTAGQFWAFTVGMKPGDWIVTPWKTKAAIAIAEVKGPAEYDPKGQDEYRVFREVKWLNKDVPRAEFDQDLLYSMGAFMTICEIKRNDAEKRVRAMQKNGWKNTGQAPVKLEAGAGEDDEETGEGRPHDLAEIARDQLIREIKRRYKGHGLQRLVEGVLKAQGFETFVPPKGPDKGVDVVAAPGPLGFGSPRICVQVKSTDSPIERAVLQQLIGAMGDVKADHGLLVSWSGFKSTIDVEKAQQFFKVRLWDQGDLIDALLANYDKLPQTLKAELPLKQIWVLPKGESDGEDEGEE